VKAELLTALQSSPAAFTDIRFERRRGTTILRRGSELEALVEHSTNGGVLRCITPGFGWGVSSFSGLDELPGALRRAQEYSLALPRRPTLALPSFPARQLDLECPPEDDPGSIPIARKLELTRLIASSVLAADRRLADVRVQYQDEVLDTVMVTSEGIALREQRPELTVSVIATADEDGTTERAVGSIAARSWPELEAWTAGVHLVGERAVLQLHAAPIRSGRYPVVLAPGAAGVLAHRAVGHLCEADADGDPRAPLLIGTRLGPDSLTIEDDPTADRLRGTRAFDHEGLPPRKTTLVQHGVVVGHVHTRTTAAAVGAAPTGSAYAAGQDAPRARLSNTYITRGKADPAELLTDISLGILVDEVIGASMDQGRTGLRAGFARQIRHGEAAEPVKGVVLSGDALVMLGQVDLIATDFAWDGSASWCDRNGGRRPITSGAPHIRLLDVLVGDTA
jgi:TldD protein